MGFMVSPKKSTITEDANEAWNEGAAIFSALLNYPSMNSGNSSGIAEWTGELSAVVSIGWKLQSWAVTADRRGNVIAFPVFSR
ncbi:hypothetical protein [Cryobacterium sp. Y29]|uniref:hypothetical protein n=1 Tax=Cryobacterium sp. Y29 TaxID=2048285 RepID=UPI0011AFF96D|nr:hypothetical protein [Cryobacterium sp. Y29]